MGRSLPPIVPRQKQPSIEIAAVRVWQIEQTGLRLRSARDASEVEWMRFDSAQPATLVWIERNRNPRAAS